MNEPVHVVLRCPEAFRAKARYVFDTLGMALRVPVLYGESTPADEGAMSIVYGGDDELTQRSIRIHHAPGALAFFAGHDDHACAVQAHGVDLVFGECAAGHTGPCDIPFDLVANAFYFLSSWSERRGAARTGESRHLFGESVFQRLGVSRTVVDDYLGVLRGALNRVRDAMGLAPLAPPDWPDHRSFAVVLSHDVDFIPWGMGEALAKGIRTMGRDLLQHRAPGDAARVAIALLRHVLQGKNPYRQVPHMVAREKAMGVRASYQIAVGRRHPNDVNYGIEHDRIRDYLRVIVDEGFDLCLHGSYLSTEDAAWYIEEARLLEARLAKPLGSRQHFLSFHYDTLFKAEEAAGIEYDMSMGFPDETGFRCGFSHPYFPYHLEDDRPYNVVQLSLFLMDVTLRSYLGLKPDAARGRIASELDALKATGGCGSIVWHPILFGGARDPGCAELFWETAERTRAMGGLATDGRRINAHVRQLAAHYASFAAL